MRAQRCPDEALTVLCPPMWFSSSPRLLRPQPGGSLGAVTDGWWPVAGPLHAQSTCGTEGVKCPDLSRCSPQIRGCRPTASPNHDAPTALGVLMGKGEVFLTCIEALKLWFLNTGPKSPFRPGLSRCYPLWLMCPLCAKSTQILAQLAKANHSLCIPLTSIQRESAFAGGLPEGSPYISGLVSGGISIWTQVLLIQKPIQQMVLGKLDIHVQKKELGPLPYTIFYKN